MFYLAVVGSRGITDAQLVNACLSKYVDQHPNLTIVSGGAGGADTLAAKFARTRDLPLIVIRPDWNRFGRSAGFKRNHQIWDRADAGIAFWDGQSKGTAHSFDIAAKQGKPIEIVRCDQRDPRDDLEYYAGPGA